jgi:hypothetical protein
LNIESKTPNIETKTPNIQAKTPNNKQQTTSASNPAHSNQAKPEQAQHDNLLVVRNWLDLRSAVGLKTAQQKSKQQHIKSAQQQYVAAQGICWHCFMLPTLCRAF